MSTQQCVQEDTLDPVEVIYSIGQRPLARFLASLMLARKSFNLAGPDHGRIGVYQALLGVIEYVSEVIPHRPDLVVPLRELLYGLRSLDQGSMVPMLQAVGLDHRPPNSTSQDLLRADAAVLMELKVAELRMQGKRKFRDEVANEVARRLNRIGLRDGKDRVVGNDVVVWRDQMRKGVQRPDFDSKRYFWTLGELKARYPNDPKGAFEFFLDCMTDLDTPTIPRKGAC